MGEFASNQQPAWDRRGAQALSVVDGGNSHFWKIADWRYGLGFSENGERGGRGSPRLKWLALFQKDDGRGSGRADPEEALYSHSDSKRWIVPHLRDQ